MEFVCSETGANASAGADAFGGAMLFVCWWRGRGGSFFGKCVHAHFERAGRTRREITAEGRCSERRRSKRIDSCAEASDTAHARIEAQKDFARYAGSAERVVFGNGPANILCE